jgi:hypothetical protein
MSKVGIKFMLKDMHFINAIEDENSVREIFAAFAKYKTGETGDGVFEGEVEGVKWSIPLSSIVAIHTLNLQENPPPQPQPQHTGKTNVPHLLPQTPFVSGQLRY